MPEKLRHSQGLVFVEQLNSGKKKLSVKLLDQDLLMPQSVCETSYPVDLIERILQVIGPAYLCDEIMRDECPFYVEQSLKNDLLSYVDEDSFKKQKILDFGCGSGSSSMVLARMFPNSEIIGVELNEELLAIAKLRAGHYRSSNVSFIPSPESDCLPANLGLFHYAVLSAVYEHLLSKERRILLPEIWAHLKPGGVLFINQTPHRFHPLESHTTGLPLINYLPDKLAWHFARRYSRRVSPDEAWETLLRRGIRGGTEKEIMNILQTTEEEPVLLEPVAPGIRDRIDLWYQVSSTKRLRTIKKCLLYCLKALYFITGITLTPNLALAVRKSKQADNR